MAGGRPPVIILGMHRSGTTLLGDLLERLGLFQGAYQEKNHEARFFLGLNRWMFQQAGADWDHPEPLLRLQRYPRLTDTMADYARRAVDGPKALGFLGPWRYVRSGSVRRLDHPWGWKDPRTTFTWPVWRKLFPEARVVHVLRHGVDVAASLRARQKYRLDRMGEHYRRRRVLYTVLPRRRELVDTLRCADPAEGLALWSLYAREGRGVLATAGERGLEVRYEDLLAKPAEVLGRVAAFAGLEPSSSDVQTAGTAAEPSRAFAYRQDTELARMASANATLLREFGYDA